MPQPVTPSAADDSAERTTLAAAITAGDPAAIRTAAQAVIAKDLVQLGQQVGSLRTQTWHTRLMLAAISAVADRLGIGQIPSEIVGALRAEWGQETPYEAFPQAAVILQTYLAALESDSAAVLT